MLGAVAAGGGVGVPLTPGLCPYVFPCKILTDGQGIRSMFIKKTFIVFLNNMITPSGSPKVDFIYDHFTDGTAKCKEGSVLFKAKAEPDPHPASRVSWVLRTGAVYAKFVFSPRFNRASPSEGTCS